MTPSEKSKELIEKFAPIVTTHSKKVRYDRGVMGAIICVEEIIADRVELQQVFGLQLMSNDYWNQVLNNLKQG